MDPQIFYMDCLYDMCSCASTPTQCLCPILASYAKECASTGVVLEWRSEVRECGVSCPAGQTYQSCGDPCTRSCSSISGSPKCRKSCVEGCNCKPGETLDESGECVPVGTCQCTQEGLLFPPGYKEIRPGTKAQQFW